MQMCTLPQTHNHASIPPLSFYRPDALPAYRPTNDVKWEMKHFSLKLYQWYLGENNSQKIIITLALDRRSTINVYKCNIEGMAGTIYVIAFYNNNHWSYFRDIFPTNRRLTLNKTSGYYYKMTYGPRRPTPFIRKLMFKKLQFLHAVIYQQQIQNSKIIKMQY